VQTLLDNDGPHTLDIVMASRVHSAGNDLMVGIMKAGRLLRRGGLLVARGPRRYNTGGYDQILAQIKRDPAMTVVANQIYNHSSPIGPESNRVIVARAR
jgi:SAM-dependent methyltransferase